MWQIGAYPLTDGNAEARGILLGFRLASGIDDPVALGAPFLSGAAPLSYLLTVVGAHMLPAGEFMWRLPYALVGAIQMPVLLLLAERFFGRRAAAFAGMLLIGSGLFAINRLATGASVFMTLELIGAIFLLRYMDDGVRRWLVFSALAFAAAALTVSAGVTMLLAAVGIAWFVRRNRRDVVIAGFTGLGLVIGYFVIAEMISAIYSNMALSELPGMSGGAASRFGIHVGGFFDSWIVYVGVPVFALVLVGIAEAVIHRYERRTVLFAVLGLVVAFAIPALVVGPVEEHPILILPLLLVIAGYGWSQVTRQLQSVATQGMIAMAVVSIAMAGVVWQQAVFNPANQFTDALSGLREYALSLEHGPGVFEDDGYGIQAVAQVLREETEQGDRIFVRDGVSAAAISLYAARSAEPMNFDDFNGGAAFLDGAFLVIRGEDETFNGGLNGAITVVANHRVFVDEKVLYQVVEFASSGEPFSTPVWWRAEPQIKQFTNEHTDFRDFLTPLHTADSTDQQPAG